MPSNVTALAAPRMGQQFASPQQQDWWAWGGNPGCGQPPVCNFPPCPPRPVVPAPIPGPIIGVTDGSIAAPGMVGEYIEANVNGTFTATVQSQAISALILQPGCWNVEAWCIMQPGSGASIGIDGAWFQLNPVPAGASNSMFVANMANPTSTDAADEAAWLTTISPRAQVTCSVPTLLAFELVTNPSATGAAGNFAFWVSALRTR